MLSSVVGHERVRRVLAASHFGNRVGHAYIFEGPQGVGKCTLAKDYARLLFCENPSGGEPCGECKNCLMCMSGNHPDLQIITNQLYDSSKKSTDVLVDTIRSMKKDIYIKPYVSERKIYIVPNADTMNLYAQNSLLKVLEEPPAYCTIILLAQNSNLFLPTIFSRTITFKLFPLELEIVEDYLKRKYPQATDEAKAIAAMSEGCIGTACALFENENVTKLRNELIGNIVALSEKSKKGIYDLTLFLKQNKENSNLIFCIMRALFRDLMFVKQNGNYGEIVNVDKSSVIEKLASGMQSFVPVKMLEIVLKYNEYVSKNISYAQIAQCMSLELWEVIHD